MFRLLLIEESFDLRENIKEFFRDNSGTDIVFDFACGFHDGLDKVRAISYDLLLIDYKIYSETDLEICRILRDSCSCPVVYVTDLKDAEEFDKCSAFCADDYLVKPFSPSDLLREIRSFMDKRPSCERILEYGGIRMNTLTGLVTADGNVVELPAKTASVLKLLMENKNETVSRNDILNIVWGNDCQSSHRVVDTHVKNLRRLLGKKGILIKNVRGIGYRIAEKGE